MRRPHGEASASNSGHEETVATNSIIVKLWKREQQGLWSHVYGHKVEDGSRDGS